MGGKVNFEGLKISAWRRFFQESDEDIFEVIEWGIKVATWCHSEEFFARRDRISEILHSVPNPSQRLRLVRDLSDDSGDEREEEDNQKQEKEESRRQEWEEDDQKQEKEESRRQKWEEDDQKQGKDESGRQEWEESVLVSTTAADRSRRLRVIKPNQAATATKLVVVALPAAEEGAKVKGTTCNDQKLKEKPMSTIVEGGAVRRKIPQKELKPVCMSDEKVKMKTEAIKRKLLQQYLEAEQAKKMPRGFR